MDARRILVVVAFLATASPAAGQWLDYRTPGIPRLPDGSPDLSAPAPKTSDGRPDISGLWRPPGGSVRDISRFLGEELPMQPWAEGLYQERRANNSQDDPTSRCVPGGVPRSNLVGYPYKILNTPGLVAILYEAVHHYRQIFTDGRQLPHDPNPNWMGYSVGRWDGDTLVVETAGFNDEGWLDNGGHPNTSALRVTERFRRKDFGHLDVEITVDDPKAYTRPWTITLPLTLAADDEILEYICSDNNRYFGHLVEQ
jgi:hypothetical protein